MKKYTIGFKIGTKSEIKTEAKSDNRTATSSEAREPKKSVVQVYFQSRGMNLAYYNDSFDLKAGDLVYVDGKLAGHRGQVTEVSYSFKIKLSDYKRVIAVIDTNVNGDFYFAGSHLVTFDRNSIPFEKVITWFKTPESDEEYASGNDDSNNFPLNDLSRMKISQAIADRGQGYYLENRVSYICVDGTHGRAIVEGSENYEVEFDYSNGDISNLMCSCFCSYTCKHDFAVMLQLKETLEFITQNYDSEYYDYFAAISKNTFMNTVVNKKNSGKISLTS